MYSTVLDHGEGGKASELVGYVETARVIHEPALVCKQSNR